MDDTSKEDEPRELDAIAAHLDRGWDLLSQGEPLRAELSARHILELDAQSPEGHTLLGAIAASRGETDEALQLYRRASELDPEFVDPLLHAAELHLSLGTDEDLEAALQLCETALDVAEEEDAWIDALLLQAETLVVSDEPDEAKAVLGELPPVDLPEASYHLRAGRLLLELGNLDDAERHLERALERDPSLTDARHAVGLLHEERGDRAKMIDAFQKVRTADLAEPRPAWAVSAERFTEIAEAAVAELPEAALRLLANVPIVHADAPSKEQVDDGIDPRLLGLFAGIPYPDAGTVGGAPPHLDTIVLFQRNIERCCRDADEAVAEIRRTVLHETGHFFGLSEEQLADLGLD